MTVLRAAPPVRRGLRFMSPRKPVGDSFRRPAAYLCGPAGREVLRGRA